MSAEADYKSCTRCGWPLVGDVYENDPDRVTCVSERHCKKRAAERAENDRQVEIYRKRTNAAAKARPLEECERMVACTNERCGRAAGIKCGGELHGKWITSIRPHVERIRLGGYTRRVQRVRDILQMSPHVVNFAGAADELAREIVDAISPLAK